LGRTTFHILWTVAFIVVVVANGGRLGTAAVAIFVGLAILTLISMYLILRYIDGRDGSTIHVDVNTLVDEWKDEQTDTERQDG
jgi:hypothetical protein